MDTFAPSMLYCFTDPLLSVNMFSLCRKSYLEATDDPKSDFMISPIHTPLEVLAKYPRVCMIVCECDPIIDDELRFAHRFLCAK